MILNALGVLVSVYLLAIATVMITGMVMGSQEVVELSFAMFMLAGVLIGLASIVGVAWFGIQCARDFWAEWQERRRHSTRKRARA